MDRRILLAFQNLGNRLFDARLMIRRVRELTLDEVRCRREANRLYEDFIGLQENRRHGLLHRGVAAHHQGYSIWLGMAHGADDGKSIGRIGHVPLPPYIRRADETGDRERYQTVFAKQPVAVAAPTAGLHFTPEILHQLREKGVEIAEITLEVGLGTFQPIRTENLDDHVMHSEAYEISQKTATAIASARRQGRPILAVGTTVVRTLEDAAQKSLQAGRPPEDIAVGRACAEIFIRP